MWAGGMYITALFWVSKYCCCCRNIFQFHELNFLPVDQLLGCWCLIFWLACNKQNTDALFHSAKDCFAFKDRQHEVLGFTTALVELPRPHRLKHWLITRSREHTRIQKLLLEVRCLLLPACLLHHVLHLESVAEAEDSVEADRRRSRTTTYV